MGKVPVWMLSTLDAGYCWNSKTWRALAKKHGPKTLIPTTMSYTAPAAMVLLRPLRGKKSLNKATVLQLQGYLSQQVGA